MKRTLNTVGKTLTAVAALMAVTANFAEADGYALDAAAHANKIIQHTPHTGHHGWKPTHKVWVKPSAFHSAPSYGHLTHSHGHGVVTYDYHVPKYAYAYKPYVKRTTIIKPVIVKPYQQATYATYGYDHTVQHQTVTDLRSPIFFNSGSSHLTPEAKAELIEIGQIIKAHIGDHKVVIQLSGFTDAKGSKAANLALAKSRNHRVKDFLIESFGFDASRFSLRAVGEAYANASVAAHDDGQRKVVVSLLGLPKQAEAPAQYGAPQASPSVGHVQPAPQPNWTASARCTLPTTPYGQVYAAGRLVGATFTDIDDYGGGQLIEYCNLGY